AEDGIRYRTVTGVQTCALPIFEPRRLEGALQPRAALRAPQGSGARAGRDADRRAAQGRGQSAGRRRGRASEPMIHEITRSATKRSEERRVGKEWREERVRERAR